MSARQIVATALLVVAAVGCGGVDSGPVSSGGKKGVETSSFPLTVRGETAVLDPSTGTTIMLPSGGLITSSTGGIDCGIVGATLHKVCVASFPYGTTGVVLTATPDTGSGYQYFMFAGACGQGSCSVDITSNRLVVVRFAKTQAALGSHPNLGDPAIHVPLYADFVAGAPRALQCTACHGTILEGQGLAPACNACHAPPPVLLNAAFVGSGGGSVTLGSGPTLSVGTGALPGATTLFVAIAMSYPPLTADAEFLGTVYEFGPSGTTFPTPVTVSFPIPPGVTNPTVYWSNAAGTGFDEIGGTIVGDTIQVQVSHFSQGGVAQKKKNFKVGATVTGLLGTGLVLENNGRDDLPILANGAFVFATQLDRNDTYAVTVAQQPTNPAQTCLVTDGAGTVGGAELSSVVVTCTTNTYQLGGAISGLLGTGLVLSTPDEPNVAVSAGATTFAFPTPIASGSAYAVSVFAQPALETCSVDNGSGTVASGDVTGVAVSCSCNSGYVALGGACVLADQSQPCLVSNGTGAQASADGGQTWSACIATACNSGYTLSAGACQCSAGTHVDAGTCAADVVACAVPNGSGTQTWDGASYGACAVASCGPGWADCDRDPANGCEKSVPTIPNICGQCGEMCYSGVPRSIVGPVLPTQLPGGASYVGAGDIGRTGGLVWQFSGFNLPATNGTGWGLSSVSPPHLSLDGTVDSPGETLQFDAAHSSLPNGILAWTGSTVVVTVSYGTVSIPTRLTLTVTAGWAAPYFDDPAELSLPASMGGIAPVQGPFSARMLMEGQWTGPTAGPLTNGSWMPVKDLYDYAPTPQPATSQVLIDVAAGFYYQPL